LPAVLIIIYEIKMMTDRLTQYEIDRRRAISRQTAQKLYGGLRPDHIQKTRTFGPTGKALLILVALLGLGFAAQPAYAQITSNTATLQGTTIRTAPNSNTGGGGNNTQTSCTSNTNVNVTNSSSQTATSGNASSDSNSGGGQATSGSANNSNSTSVNVGVTGC
jgi:hypothetical protein